MSLEEGETADSGISFPSFSMLGRCVRGFERGWGAGEGAANESLPRPARSDQAVHAVLFCRISANNFRLASCIRKAAVVSLSAPACFSKSACVVPGFSRRAKSGI